MEELFQTCSQNAVNGSLFGFKYRPANLSGWAGVGCGGWGVGLRGKVWKRVAVCHQDLGGTHEADAVQAWQDHRLFDYVFTHRAMQLMLQALHVRLWEAGRWGINICTGCWTNFHLLQKHSNISRLELACVIKSSINVLEHVTCHNHLWRD